MANARGKKGNGVGMIDRHANCSGHNRNKRLKRARARACVCYAPFPRPILTGRSQRLWHGETYTPCSSPACRNIPQRTKKKERKKNKIGSFVRFFCGPCVPTQRSKGTQLQAVHGEQWGAHAYPTSHSERSDANEDAPSNV